MPCAEWAPIVAATGISPVHPKLCLVLCVCRTHGSSARERTQSGQSVARISPDAAQCARTDRGSICDLHQLLRKSTWPEKPPPGCYRSPENLHIELRATLLLPRRVGAHLT